MDHLPDIAKLLEGLGVVLWPVFGLIVLFKVWPVVESVLQTAKSRKFTFKVGGQELSMEEASQQSRSLIDGLQNKVLELSRSIEAISDSALPVQTDAATLASHHFEGDDLALRKSRTTLADNISHIIDSGLDEFSLSQIQPLVIAQHNASWSYVITESNVSNHLAEAEALYEDLTKKLVSAPSNKHHGEIASALGIMKHNMLGRIPRLRKKAEEKVTNDA